MEEKKEKQIEEKATTEVWLRRGEELWARRLKLQEDLRVVLSWTILNFCFKHEIPYRY